MASFLIRRVFSGVVVVVLVLVMLALLVRLIPGDPLQAMLGAQSADPTLTAQLREDMGVDDPVLVQVGEFAAAAVRGDLGTNVISSEPVATEIGRALPYTVTLAATSLAIALVVGALLGVLAASRPGSVLDRVLGGVSVACLAIPSYVAALFLLLIFAVWLEVLPSLGAGEESLGSFLVHLILPAFSLAIAWIGLLARLVRANLLEVVNEPYMRAARAAGVPERTVMLKYGLKNALIPTVALLALGMGNMLAGAVFVEIIYARPGLGYLLVNAINTRNFPVVRGAVFVIAVTFVVLNLCADILYRFIDPRVRVERSAA